MTPRGRRLRGAAVLLVVTTGLLLACDPGPDPGAPVLDLPPRPADAPGGDQIVEELQGLDVEAREDRVFAEVARGNIPGWLRQLERVEVTMEVPVEVAGPGTGETEGDATRTRRLTFWAMPDYLSIGSDDDFFYVPLSPRTALRIAELTGASLPTPWLVDAIWMEARVRLIPIRFRPDEHMGSLRYFNRHNHVVQAQRRQHGARPGQLVAGHKLDVVRLSPAPGPPADSPAVGLYGWHLSDGAPIQPVHPVDPATPPHFSMGLRLVDRRILLDGIEVDVEDALRDPDLAGLLAYSPGSSPSSRWRERSSSRLSAGR